MVLLDTGITSKERELVVSVDGIEVLREETHVLRREWQATSIMLEKQQTNPSCVEAEEM